jgi:hypothetical protein
MVEPTFPATPEKKAIVPYEISPEKLPQPGILAFFSKPATKRGRPTGNFKSSCFQFD